MSDKLIYRYEAKKRAGRGAIPGVPLRDLTEADLARLPEHLLPSIQAAPYYVDQRRKPASKAAKAAEEAES